MSKDDDGEETPRGLGIGKGALKRVADLARQVLREEGFPKNRSRRC
ncbi:MAG: hypothetical protein ACT4OF_05850 [Caulobacteraceae bacterium]